VCSSDLGQGTVSTQTNYSFEDVTVVSGATYAYRLLAEDTNGELNELSLTTVNYSPPNSDVVTEYRLVGNYPNPFNPSTRLLIELAETSTISLDVFDVSGRFVQTLASGSYDAGSHRVEFQAAGLPSGVYLARLSGVFGTRVMKMMLLK
jgi:hypothetical protein